MDGCPNKCSTGVGVVPGIWVELNEYCCGSRQYPGGRTAGEVGGGVGHVIGGLEVD